MDLEAEDREQEPLGGGPGKATLSLQGWHRQETGFGVRSIPALPSVRALHPVSLAPSLGRTQWEAPTSEFL